MLPFSPAKVDYSRTALPRGYLEFHFLQENLTDMSKNNSGK